jgi:GTP cyclohydrolase II
MSAMQTSETKLSTQYGAFDFLCFNFGSCEQDNILVLRNPSYPAVPVCRVQSACYTAEIFRSLDCDCHEQLDSSLRRISIEGGILIYMLCDGRGAGLLTKVRGLELTRSHGLDTADAYRHLGVPEDPRNYDRVAEVLGHLGIAELKLLTNNPRKVDGLVANGFRVHREPMEVAATDASRPYLQAKHQKLGHMLTQFGDRK